MSAKKTATKPQTKDPTSGQLESGPRQAQSTTKKVKPTGTESPPTSIDAQDSGDKAQAVEKQGQARQEVVHLATQMVCAQMIAESQYDLTFQLAQRFEGMFEILARQFSTSEQKTGDSPDLVKGLMGGMAEMRRLRSAIRKPPSLLPMSHSDLDRYFQAAVFRASRLLESPEKDTRTVYAEQLFQPHETLSENQIFERFRDFGWPKLSGKDSIVALFEGLHQWYYNHHRKLQPDASTRTDATETGDMSQNEDLLNRMIHLSVELRSLLYEASENGTIPPQVEDSFGLYRSLSKLIEFYDPPLKKLGQQSRNRHQSNLVVMFFCDTPIERNVTEEAEDKDGKKSKSPDRNYRPWSLFRYLRGYGNAPGDQEGRDLNARLCIERRKLNRGKPLDVDGVYPAEYAFGPIGEELQELLDSENWDGEVDPDDPDFERVD